MKITIAYEVFYFFLKVYTFEELLILNSLYSKYIANITFNQLTKWCFTLWFYNFILKMCKSKNENDTFMRKKT